ncbi:hypothetical protein [Terrabacter sp. NPDC000476]|uniref:hypothetical protein n=1 Tax=Terrabacter sp. NPDC000476 TaxID=3154258 RepID=UPI00331E7A6F
MTNQQHTSTEPVAVISPTLDDATIEATLWLIDELRSDGFSVEQVAQTAAEHLADAVARYGTERNRNLQLVESHAMETLAAASSAVDVDYDPTDAELEQSLRAEGWSERNAAVLRLVADIESGAVA